MVPSLIHTRPITTMLRTDPGVTNNGDLTLHDIHKRYKTPSDGFITIPNTIKSHILGLMWMEGLQDVIIVGPGPRDRYLKKAVAIINKHLKGARDIHACQEEMLEAGLGNYAKL